MSSPWCDEGRRERGPVRRGPGLARPSWVPPGALPRPGLRRDDHGGDQRGRGRATGHCRLFAPKIDLKALLDVSIVGDDEDVAVTDRPEVRSMLAEEDGGAQLAGFVRLTMEINGRTARLPDPRAQRRATPRPVPPRRADPPAHAGPAHHHPLAGSAGSCRPVCVSGTRPTSYTRSRRPSSTASSSSTGSGRSSGTNAGCATPCAASCCRRWLLDREPRRSTPPSPADPQLQHQPGPTPLINGRISSTGRPPTWAITSPPARLLPRRCAAGSGLAGHRPHPPRRATPTTRTVAPAGSPPVSPPNLLAAEGGHVEVAPGAAERLVARASMK